MRIRRCPLNLCFFIVITFSSLAEAVSPEQLSEWFPSWDRSDKSICTKLVGDSSQTHAQGLPRVMIGNLSYLDDYPVAELQRATKQADGRFLIGWVDGDASVNFKSVVKVESLQTNHPDYAFSKELWRWANDEDWMVQNFQSISPSTPADKILSVRTRGVEVASVRLLDEQGKVLDELKVSDNNPYSFSLAHKDLEARFERLPPNSVAKVEIWHTHPNGVPFSLQDYLSLAGRTMMDDLVEFSGNAHLQYKIFVVTQTNETLVRYTMAVK